MDQTMNICALKKPGAQRAMHFECRVEDQLRESILLNHALRPRCVRSAVAVVYSFFVAGPLRSWRRGGDGPQASSSPAITFMLLMVRIASLSMVPLIISG